MGKEVNQDGSINVLWDDSEEVETEVKQQRVRKEGNVMHAHGARKVFEDHVCCNKQALDKKMIRYRHLADANQSDDAPESPSTRAPSPGSPLRGWDMTASPYQETIREPHIRRHHDEDDEEEEHEQEEEASPPKSPKKSKPPVQDSVTPQKSNPPAQDSVTPQKSNPPDQARSSLKSNPPDQARSSLKSNPPAQDSVSPQKSNPAAQARSSLKSNPPTQDTRSSLKSNPPAQDSPPLEDNEVVDNNGVEETPA